jgi:hypothetical protein
VKYLNKRAALFKQDKLGLNYDVIQMKALDLAQEIAKQYGMDHYKTFEASNKWIRNVITRNSFVNIKAHGEAGDIDEKETAAAMKIFVENGNAPRLYNSYSHVIEDSFTTYLCTVQQVCTQYCISFEHIYNGDQMGLYYRRYPKRVLIHKKDRKNFRGSKNFNHKERATVMVCTSPTEKVDLAFISKAQTLGVYVLCAESQHQFLICINIMLGFPLRL